MPFIPNPTFSSFSPKPSPSFQVLEVSDAFKAATPGATGGLVADLAKIVTCGDGKTRVTLQALKHVRLMNSATQVQRPQHKQRMGFGSEGLMSFAFPLQRFLQLLTQRVHIHTYGIKLGPKKTIPILVFGT